MTRLVTTLSVLALIVCLGGCVLTAPAPVNGILLTMDTGGPHAWSGEFDNGVAATKSGMAEAQGVLGVSWGDASVNAAMANGGLTKIHHIDCKTFNVLGIYAKSTTIVWGE